MNETQIKLYDKQDYNYAYGDFIPTLNTYFHDDEKERPAIIIAPGGGYMGIAAIEAYIVAMPYYNSGYQVFVLTYSINTLNTKPLKLQPLQDISRAICHVRKNSNEYNVISNQIAVCGFSAGGHLVGSLAVHYDNPAIKHSKDVGISNRPDAVILCYAQLTTGKFGVDWCMDILLGSNALQSELDFMSPEKHVTSDTPPAFLWHTKTDEVVPVENSIVFKDACSKAGIDCEMHLFPKGPHGMSIATKECSGYDYHRMSEYTFAQSYEDMKYGVVKFPDKFPSKFQSIVNMSLPDYIEAFIIHRKELSEGNDKVFVDPTVAKWLPKSIEFLTKIWEKEIRR